MEELLGRLNAFLKPGALFEQKGGFVLSREDFGQDVSGEELFDVISEELGRCGKLLKQVKNEYDRLDICGEFIKRDEFKLLPCQPVTAIAEEKSLEEDTVDCPKRPPLSRVEPIDKDRVISSKFYRQHIDPSFKGLKLDIDWDSIQKYKNSLTGVLEVVPVYTNAFQTLAGELGGGQPLLGATLLKIWKGYLEVLLIVVSRVQAEARRDERMVELEHTTANLRLVLTEAKEKLSAVEQKRKKLRNEKTSLQMRVQADKYLLNELAVEEGNLAEEQVNTNEQLHKASQRLVAEEEEEARARVLHDAGDVDPSQESMIDKLLGLEQGTSTTDANADMGDGGNMFMMSLNSTMECVSDEGDNGDDDGFGADVDSIDGARETSLEKLNQEVKLVENMLEEQQAAMQKEAEALRIRHMIKVTDLDVLKKLYYEAVAFKHSLEKKTMNDRYYARDASVSHRCTHAPPVRKVEVGGKRKRKKKTTKVKGKLDRFDKMRTPQQPSTVTSHVKPNRYVVHDRFAQFVNLSFKTSSLQQWNIADLTRMVALIHKTQFYKRDCLIEEDWLPTLVLGVFEDQYGESETVELALASFFYSLSVLSFGHVQAAVFNTVCAKPCDFTVAYFDLLNNYVNGFEEDSVYCNYNICEGDDGVRWVSVDNVNYGLSRCLDVCSASIRENLEMVKREVHQLAYEFPPGENDELLEMVSVDDVMMLLIREGIVNAFSEKKEKH